MISMPIRFTVMAFDTSSTQLPDYWEHLGKIAPVFTASIALAAAIIALISLLVQRSLARKKAAIDFFLKTEMDSAMLSAYYTYREGLEMVKHLDIEAIDKFKTQEEAKAKAESANTQQNRYRAVRTYLDVTELLAIGVRKKAFDEKLCYGFWYSILVTAANDGNTFIKYVQDKEGKNIYCELIDLRDRWVKRAALEKLPRGTRWFRRVFRRTGGAR